MIKKSIRKRNYLKFILNSVAFSAFILSMNTGCFSQNQEYTIIPRTDGGYKIDIACSKRHLKPITAEGIFPKETKKYTIDIIGKGKDWTFREQAGYYYSSENVRSKKKAWDFGYAWIDAKRKYIYLNFYWVSAPEGIAPSDVNGKYNIK